MTQDKLEALLGRSLTPREVDNLSLYLQIAEENLDELLCTSIEEVTETRTYEARDGYSTVFTDIFQTVTEVKVNGEATTDYYKAQWDRRNGSWYNSIVFSERFDDTDTLVEVTGTWGFDPSNTPVDLQRLLAQMFAVASTKYQTNDVKSKKVEDFSVTYSDITTDEKVAADNALTISKYSQCNTGYVLHGRTC